MDVVAKWQALIDKLIAASVEVLRGGRTEASRWMMERKHWHYSKTLNPKAVADGGSFDGAYIFYSELSTDAHPRLEALTRYLARDDKDQALTRWSRPWTSPG